VTLAIAVVEELNSGKTQIYLGSDSQMSSSSHSSHYCVKVSPVRVKAVEPLDEGQAFDDARVAFDSVYGIAFSGNVAGMHVF
jgi:hypothetical protein